MSLLRLGSLFLFACCAFAQTAPNDLAQMKDAVAAAQSAGDNAWMLISAALVLMMTGPGLALFYGGLVRHKNVLGTMMQSFAMMAVVTLIWGAVGYSLVFGEGSPFLGDLRYLFLNGVGAAPNTDYAPTIPHLTFMAYQMMFAIITPALIAGAFAERVRFSAMILFSTIWLFIVYFPVAHMVWGKGGFLNPFLGGSVPVFDFAGGTVVHITSGFSALIAAIMLGKRKGYPHEPMKPHSLVLSFIGACMLWVGWFGFNAGSNLEASGGAALAMINSFVATAAAALSWMFAEWIVKGKPSLLGACSGAVAGLVAVTPAAGYAGPMGALVLGLVVGVVCLFFCSSVKNMFGYDDALDVFGVHCVGGIVGAIATGILVNPALGGTGIMDYTTGKIGEYDFAAQMIAQCWGVGTTLVWSGIGSLIIYKIVDLIVGLRASVEKEREGLDLTDHGERAYNM